MCVFVCVLGVGGVVETGNIPWPITLYPCIHRMPFRKSQLSVLAFQMCAFHFTQHSKVTNARAKALFLFKMFVTSLRYTIHNKKT